MEHAEGIGELFLAEDELAVDAVDPRFYVAEVGVDDFGFIEPTAQDEVMGLIEHGTLFHAAFLIERTAGDFGEDEVVAFGTALTFEERFEAFAVCFGSSVDSEQIEQRGHQIEFADQGITDEWFGTREADDKRDVQTEVVRRHFAVRIGGTVIAHVDDEGVGFHAGVAESVEGFAKLFVGFLNAIEVFGPVAADGGGVRQMRWKRNFGGINIDGLLFAVHERPVRAGDAVVEEEPGFACGSFDDASEGLFGGDLRDEVVVGETLVR